MQKTPQKRRRFRAFFLVAVVAAAVLAICSTLTYPKTVVSFPVSFTIGANLEDREFGM